MVRPLLYTTINMLLIPDCLQSNTACLMLSRLSRAVLAVVVSHTPRMALGFQTGPGGGGGGVGAGVLPPFLLQAASERQPLTISNKNDFTTLSVVCTMVNSFSKFKHCKTHVVLKQAQNNMGTSSHLPQGPAGKSFQIFSLGAHQLFIPL
jgi:hypothetical protein